MMDTTTTFHKSVLETIFEEPEQKTEHELNQETNHEQESEPENIQVDLLNTLNVVDILNIFNVYYKTLFVQNPENSLFDGVEGDTSTNRAMEKLYEEIYRYKTTSETRFKELFDPEQYRKKYLVNDPKLPEDYPFYLVQISGQQKVCHSLITVLFYISNFDWCNTEWSINQVNEF